MYAYAGTPPPDSVAHLSAGVIPDRRSSAPQHHEFYQATHSQPHSPHHPTHHEAVEPGLAGHSVQDAIKVTEAAAAAYATRTAAGLGNVETGREGYMYVYQATGTERPEDWEMPAQ